MGPEKPEGINNAFWEGTARSAMYVLGCIEARLNDISAGLVHLCASTDELRDVISELNRKKKVDPERF